MKMTTHALAEARYGGIDFSSGHWAEQGKWIQLLDVSELNLPNWHVLGTQLPVRHIACNVDIHEPLMNALKSVLSAGLGNLLRTFDGCFNIRLVRGSATSVSTHSYGLAIDINAGANPLGATSGGFYIYPNFVRCFTEQGFDWGGNFSHRKDPMHFSYGWE